MAKKPTRKTTAKKSTVTKIPAGRYKATPAGKNDRQHLIEVIQDLTGCTAVAARETMTAILGTITVSLNEDAIAALNGSDGRFVFGGGLSPETAEAGTRFGFTYPDNPFMGDYIPIRQLRLTVIPEPSTLVLLCLGVVVVVFYRMIAR